MRNVLIVSNPDDEHTKVVATKIAALGGNPVLFSPEHLGQSLHFSLALDSGSATPIALLVKARNGVPTLDFRRMQAVWYRRPRIPALPEFGLGADGTDFARDEWRAALEGTYALLEEPLWVSHPDRLREAARKPYQLMIARKLGMDVPRTLITNNPLRAREFIEQSGGRVIVKATGPGWVVTPDTGAVAYVLTNRLTSADIADLSDLEIAPVTIQEEIPKAYELRVNVVGSEVLAIRIDSQSSPRSQLDWRRYDVTRTPYTPYVLPPGLQRQVLRLTRMLGLEFGAVDIIRDLGGRYVFLEINGNGQFLWAEELSGVGVSEAIARLLVGQISPLRASNFL